MAGAAGAGLGSTGTVQAAVAFLSPGNKEKKQLFNIMSQEYFIHQQTSAVNYTVILLLKSFIVCRKFKLYFLVVSIACF